MSKSILVVDTPNNCVECLFSEMDGLFCPIVGCNMSKTEAEQKPKWCPLREIPQKQKYHKNPNGYFDAWDNGWNDCIDEILKERD